MTKKIVLPILLWLSTALFTNAQSNSSASGNHFYGLDYGVNQNACPSYDQIKGDFQTIKQYTNRVRTFSISTCKLGELALQAANELDMNIYLGMWIDSPATFSSELSALKSLLGSSASFSKVDAVIVGSEVLYRNDADPDTMANYLKQVGDIARPKKIAITTADVYYKFPAVVVQQLDFLMMNAFPYWEGVTADQGAAKLMEHYQTVVGQAMGKPVRISETGWPTAGSNFGAAVASPENQKTYLSNVLCQTRKNNIDMIWFEAMDEPYKQGVEANWGIMNSDKSIKSAYADGSTFSNPTC